MKSGLQGYPIPFKLKTQGYDSMTVCLLRATQIMLNLLNFISNNELRHFRFQFEMYRMNKIQVYRATQYLSS